MFLKYTKTGGSWGGGGGTIYIHAYIYNLYITLQSYITRTPLKMHRVLGKVIVCLDSVPRGSQMGMVKKQK